MPMPFKRPIMLIDDTENKNEEIYEPMEEEDEEDYPEYAENQLTNASYNMECILHDYDPRAQCVVCGRSFTTKYLLFRLPTESNIRINWAHSLQIPPSSLSTDSVICAHHFTAADFVVTDGQMFWDRSAVPKVRREGEVDEDYPWEKHRLWCEPEQSTSNKDAGDHSNYQVTYRRSFYKNKGKASHEVAIVSKLDTNTYLEFSYNRTSQLDGTKFYTCLGCRKAKADTNVKDVIRTIHIDGTVILSKGDPFYRHHFSCVPFTAETNVKNYRPAITQPMHMDMADEYAGNIIYVDEDGTQHGTDVWEAVDAGSLLNIEEIPFYGQLGPKIDSDDKVKQIYIPPTRTITKAKRKHVPKCHLCFRVLKTTEDLVRHLNRHLESQCSDCSKRISSEYLVISSEDSKRTRYCNQCRRKRNLLLRKPS